MQVTGVNSQINKHCVAPSCEKKKKKKSRKKKKKIKKSFSVELESLQREIRKMEREEERLASLLLSAVFISQKRGLVSRFTDR